jgi:hypothetical protein
MFLPKTAPSLNDLNRQDSPMAWFPLIVANPPISGVLLRGPFAAKLRLRKKRL